MTRQQVFNLIAEYMWLNREWEAYPANFAHETNYRFVRNMKRWDSEMFEEPYENTDLVLPLMLAVLDRNISIYEAKKESYAAEDFEGTYERISQGLTQRLKTAEATLKFIRQNTRQDNKEGFIQDAENERKDVEFLENELLTVGLYKENLYKVIYEHSLILRSRFGKSAPTQKRTDDEGEQDAPGAKLLIYALYIFNNKALNKTKYCNLVAQITGNKLKSVENKYKVVENYHNGIATDGQAKTFEDFNELLQNKEQADKLRQILKLT